MLPSIDERVVGRHRDVVLDQRAAFEHRDVRDAVVALVHDHQVATGRTALAVRAAPALQRLAVERVEQRGAVDVDVARACAPASTYCAGPARWLRSAAAAAAAGRRARRAGALAAAAGLAAAPAAAPAAALLAARPSGSAAADASAGAGAAGRRVADPRASAGGSATAGAAAARGRRRSVRQPGVLAGLLGRCRRR